MSALAMILAATLAVPGDGAEKVSAEVERPPQPLDLRGEWTGTMRNYHGLFMRVHLNGGKLKAVDETTPGGFASESPISFIDEGNGKFRLRLDSYLYLGIYRQVGDRFIACFGDKLRPSEFKLAEQRGLMTLHRVKH